MDNRHTTSTTGWSLVTVATGHGTTRTLPAEPAAPGLVIVPDHEPDLPRWTDGYRVVHQASGTPVSPSGLRLAHARELAHALATGADWTRPAGELHTDPDVHRHTDLVLFDLSTARDFGGPVFWARRSWRQVHTRTGHHLWELACGVPFCTAGDDTGPAVLTDPTDDSEHPQPLRNADQVPLIVHARADGWRQDATRVNAQQWMCPYCADYHPRTHD
ncbi:hypothetical protein [Saccharothrix sp. NRRL B-16314]|uniref:hypothetical protein n=1 Tax=Saccharothrix sp. NRRL B-16314 TaxID=1463825 RepID=UPI000525D064|nr:hypothetical protein [Saccharothrix sp. NRRL B-16314]